MISIYSLVDTDVLYNRAIDNVCIGRPASSILHLCPANVQDKPEGFVFWSSLTGLRADPDVHSLDSWGKQWTTQQRDDELLCCFCWIYVQIIWDGVWWPFANWVIDHLEFSGFSRIVAASRWLETNQQITCWFSLILYLQIYNCNINI